MPARKIMINWKSRISNRSCMTASAVACVTVLLCHIAVACGQNAISCPSGSGACLTNFLGVSYRCKPGDNRWIYADPSGCAINCNTQACVGCAYLGACSVSCADACPGAPICQGCTNEQLEVMHHTNNLTDGEMTAVGCIEEKAKCDIEAAKAKGRKSPMQCMQDVAKCLTEGQRELEMRDIKSSRGGPLNPIIGTPCDPMSIDACGGINNGGNIYCGKPTWSTFFVCLDYRFCRDVACYPATLDSCGNYAACERNTTFTSPFGYMCVGGSCYHDTTPVVGHAVYIE